MNKNIKKTILHFILLILPVTFYAQNDVTKFLDIPIDGYKPEMVQKLKSKGFTINPYSKDKDIFDGEFNGINVNLLIGTNNNKVWRIIVNDAISTKNEANIKIRFNNLIQQFVNNERYLIQTDSTIAKYMIPKDEDISYEISVKDKRYQATFYQKTIKYDSLTKEKDLLLAKDTLNDKEKERLLDLMVDLVEESLNSMNKRVWFTIKEDYGEYSIVIFYENLHNEANGKGL